MIQRRHKVDAGSYIGSGKAEEIAQLAVAEDAEVVIFDNDLTPSQIGQLERIINQHAGRKYGDGINVIDRSELILDIFATRARTYEAKLQVELAQMEYTYPRLAKMWGHLERIASGAGGGMGIGTRGPGETQLETDRRLVASGCRTSRATSRRSRTARPASWPSGPRSTSPCASSATPTPARARCSTR